MKILAIESSAKAASVAIVEDGRILGETFLNCGLTHSVTIMPSVEWLLDVCGLKVKEKLFDSEIHKWNINDSEFGKKLKGRRYVCIVIEDTNNNIFGGYISKKIGINKYHYDSKSYLFSIKRNGEWKMKKYPLKENCYDLKVFLDDNDVLFAFGAEDKDNTNYLRDILVYKKDLSNRN